MARSGGLGQDRLEFLRGSDRRLAGELAADVRGRRPGHQAAPAEQRQAFRNRAADEYRKAREVYEGLRARGLLPAADVKNIAELQAEELKLKPAAR